MKEPPQPAVVIRTDPAEELLKEYPELEAFGVEWVRAWTPHARERLVEIAKVMRKYPWIGGCDKAEANEHPPPLHGGG
jgi:hypothetical protein